jgi:hypothetical protein
MKLRLAGFLAVLWLCCATVRAEITPAITPTDLDLAHCVAFDGGKAVAPAPPRTLEVILGCTAAPASSANLPAWEVGPAGPARHFRIAFTRPIPVGTIYSQYPNAQKQMAGYYDAIGQRTLSVLKPTAAYPGDVTKEEEWLALPVGRLLTLPPGYVTRAVRFTERFTTALPTKSRIALTVLLTERYYNALKIGWTKTLPTGENTRWLASWNEQQAIAGLLVIAPDVPPGAVEAMKPENTAYPLIADKSAWHTVRAVPEAQAAITILRFPQPVSTRALRLTTRPWTPKEIFPLAPLGDATRIPSLDLLPPPFEFGYQMPMDGFIAIDIFNKQTGKRVRQLEAEIERPAGNVVEHWDLKNANGQLVEPGEYIWKAFARPPFKLTYELTVNTGVVPPATPWWTFTHGRKLGAWTADHSSPSSIAAVGGHVFIGSPCAEDGDGLIAVDTKGVKVWGEGSVSGGFRGADRVAQDGRCAYLVNDAVIQRVDPQRDFAADLLYTFNYTRSLPGGTLGDPTRGGAAAWKDKLYVAFATDSIWLHPSFPAELIDRQRCMPLVTLKKGKYSDVEYTEIDNFNATFFADVPSSIGADFGEAPVAGPQANALTVSFKQPIPVGSVLIPSGAINVYALKPGHKLPDALDSDGPDADDGGDADAVDPFDSEEWVPLQNAATANRAAVALAPAGGVMTTALRFKARRLPFALIMAHRLADVVPQAVPVCTEGTVTANGSWRVARNPDAPLQAANPGLMALTWKTPVPVRGVSLCFPLTDPGNCREWAVDVWTGPDDVDPSIAVRDDAHWRQAGAIAQERHGWCQPAPAVRTVDFGEMRTVRAVRVRALKGYAAALTAVVAYTHLGEDPALPVDLSGRITEFQLPPAGPGKEPKLTVIRHLPLAKPGNLAFDRDGTLYAVSRGQVVTVPLHDGETSRVVVTREKLTRPAGLATDGAGLLYVCDLGPKVIRVFDVTTGALMRTLGKPGGQQLGKWDPERQDQPTSVCVAGDGKIWTTDAGWQPKRVQRWRPDGTVEQSFLGPPPYGGGGYMDEGNRNVVNYQGMKFVIDWPTRTWKLDSLLFRPGNPRSLATAMPDRAVYFQGRRYLTHAPTNPGPVVAICEERNNIAVPLAATGNLKDWPDVDARPDLRTAFGSMARENFTFIWSDLNGDGQPQPEEVQLMSALAGPRVGQDLSLNYAGARLPVARVLPSGVPVYDPKHLLSVPLTARSTYAANSWTTADGRTFSVYNQLIAADGKTPLWEYVNKYAHHDGFYASGFGYNRPPGVLNQEYNPLGHFSLRNAQGRLEDYFVTNSDAGDWFCYTGDGFLAGCIFGGPTGYGLRRWTMPTAEPGVTDLADIRLFQEAYAGCIVKANDGKVYAVAEKNHCSIVRVDGLERAQRLEGTLVVTPDDLARTLAWENENAVTARLRQEAKVAMLPYLDAPPTINGSLDEWPESLFCTIHDYWVRGLRESRLVLHSKGALAVDDTHLYIAARIMDDSPARNSAQDPRLLFKGGDALDVTLGVEATADPKRTTAGAGDLRILIAQVKGHPVAVLYRPVAPGSPAAKTMRFTSPTGNTVMDLVTVLDTAEVSIQREDGAGRDGGGYLVEAAIPWTALGVAPPRIGDKLRGDLGVLQSDQHGVSTVNRLYWAGKSQTGVSDIPTEARLTPALWGELYITEPDKSMPSKDVELAP